MQLTAFHGKEQATGHFRPITVLRLSIAKCDAGYGWVRDRRIRQAQVKPSETEVEVPGTRSVRTRKSVV
jgi:hypothetical protein